MKVAVPMAAGRLSMHFGHCESFAIVEVDEENKTISNTTYVTPPPHEPGVLPAWLHDQGVNVVVAGGMGMRAQQLFNQNEIQVIVGAPAEEPETLVNALLNETLESGANLCDH